MTQNNTPLKLYLLIPWDLPVEQQLSEENKLTLFQVLKQLLYALDRSDEREALSIIDRELANLDVSGISPASISSTQTALKPWEVEEFNNYFKLMHVETKEPAICLTWSLLTAYKTFLMLDESGNKFNATQVEFLKGGFRSYAYLLARTFSISL